MDTIQAGRSTATPCVTRWQEHYNTLCHTQAGTLQHLVSQAGRSTATPCVTSWQEHCNTLCHTLAGALQHLVSLPPPKMHPYRLPVRHASVHSHVLKVQRELFARKASSLNLDQSALFVSVFLKGLCHLNAMTGCQNSTLQRRDAVASHSSACLLPVLTSASCN